MESSSPPLALLLDSREALCWPDEPWQMRADAADPTLWVLDSTQLTLQAGTADTSVLQGVSITACFEPAAECSNDSNLDSEPTARRRPYRPRRRLLKSHEPHTPLGPVFVSSTEYVSHIGTDLAGLYSLVNHHQAKLVSRHTVEDSVNRRVFQDLVRLYSYRTTRFGLLLHGRWLIQNCQLKVPGVDVMDPISLSANVGCASTSVQLSFNSIPKSALPQEARRFELLCRRGRFYTLYVLLTMHQEDTPIEQRVESSLVKLAVPIRCCHHSDPHGARL